MKSFMQEVAALFLAVMLMLILPLTAAAQLPNKNVKPAQGKLSTAEGAPANEPTGPVFLVTRLSPSGSRLAIAAWSANAKAGSLQVYELKEGEGLALERPSWNFGTEEEILAFAWAQDEKSLAALTKLELQDAGLPRAFVTRIRVLELQTGEWTSVGTGDLPRESLSVSGFGMLSWDE